MAIKKTIEIEIKDNVNVTTDHFEDLNDEIKAVKKQADDLSKSFESNGDAIEKSFKPLKAQFREAQQQVAELSEKFGATSKEAINAAKRAAELKDAIGDAKDLTDAFNPDAKFNALSNSIGGVLNGFEAFQGTLGLLGVESEDVEKTLLKVQSAMALSQGIQGLMEAKDSFKQLGAVVGQLSIVQKISTAAQWLWNAAMNANPLGAIILTITALIAAGYKLISFFQESAAENERVAKSIDKHTDALKKQQKQIEYSSKKQEEHNKFVYDYAKASGKSAEELRKLAVKHQEEEIALAKKNAELAKSTYLREKDILATMVANDADEELIKKQRELTVQAREGATKAREALAEERKDLQDLRKQQIIDKRQELTDAKKAASEKKTHTKSSSKSDDIVKKKQEELAELERLQNEANQNRIKEENEVLSSIEAATQENYNRTLTQNELEIQAVNDKYNILLEKAREYGQDTIELEKARDAELGAIKDKSLEDEGAKLRAFYEQMMAENKKQKEAEKILQEQKIQGVKDGFSTIGSLAQLFAGKNEEQQKRAFKVQKAANIANTLIDTYSSATKSYNSLAGVPYVGPVLGFAAAAAAVAAGLVNVKNISQQQFESASSSGGGGGTPPPLNASATQPAPSFNIVGNGNIGQLASLNQAPVQAYVVSGEVTSQQALDRNRLRNATF